MASIFKNKVYWLDDTDLWLARSKIAAAREKYPECEWVRYRDDTYKDMEDAYRNLVSCIGTFPMFTEGKIVYCYGIPLKKAAGEYHQSLAKEFGRIPDNVCFMIIARPDRGSSLYKAAKTHGQADEPFELGKTNAVAWITEQAELVKLKIDKQSCQILADLTDFSPAKIQQELEKLKFIAPDGMVSPRLIGMSGFGDGSCDVKDLGTYILNNDGEKAHEYLQRLLDRGEPPIKICGFLQDWLNRLAMAQSVGCNFDMMRADVAGLKKWQSDKEDDDSRKYESVDDGKWGHFSRRRGSAIPMFANSNSLFHSCSELSAADKGPNWAYDALYRMYRLQIRLRTGGDEVKAMHQFLSEVTKPKNKAGAE